MAIAAIELAKRMRRSVPTWVPAIVLTFGLILCVPVLLSLMDDVELIFQFNPWATALATAAGLCSLALSAIAWIRYLESTSGVRIQFALAMDQLAMVLIGKYIPGKVTGLAARVLALGEIATARKVTAATAIEQLGAIAAAVTLGSAAWLLSKLPVAGFTALSLLAIAWLGALAAGRRLDEKRSSQATSATAFLYGVGLQLLQWSCLLVSVICLATMALADVEFSTLFGVAGAYGIAVVLGQLAFIFPGGIGPREGAFVWLCSGILAPFDALALALILRIATTLLDLLSAAIYVFNRLRGSGSTVQS